MADESDEKSYAQRLREAAQKVVTPGNAVRVVGQALVPGAGPALALSSAEQALAPDEGPDPYQTDGAPRGEAVPEEGSARVQDEDETDALNTAAQQSRDIGGLGASGPQKEIVGGHNAEPLGGWGMVGDVQNTHAAMQDTEQSMGQLAQDRAKEENALIQEQLKEKQAMLAAEIQQRANERAESERRLKDLEAKANEIAKQKIDTGRIFHSPAGVIGAIAASFMPLFTRNPDDGIRVINTAIQRDINVQAQNIGLKQASFERDKGLYQDYLNLTKDDQIARAMTEARMKDIAATKLLEVASRYKGPEAMMIAQKNALTLRREGSILMMDIFSRMWREPKYVDHAMKVFFGQNMQRPFSGSTVQDMHEARNAGRTAVSTEGTTAEPEGWNLDKSEGGYYKNDVDYIRNAGKPGQEDLPQITSTNDKDYVPEVPVTRIEGSSAPARKDVPNVPVEKARKALGAQVNAIEAVDALTKSRDAEYAKHYRDPAVAKQLSEYRDTYIYGEMAGGKTLKQAYGEWLKEVKHAEKEGLGAISKATAPLVEGEHISANMARHMSAVERNPGFRPDDKLSKINLLNPNWRRDLHQWQLNTGLTSDPEAIKAMEDLYTQYAFLKGKEGKEMLGALSAGDRVDLEAMFPKSPTWAQLKTATNYISRMSRKKMTTASASGGRVAQLMWRASHNTISNPNPYQGRPGPGPREAKTVRDVNIPPTVIK